MLILCVKILFMGRHIKVWEDRYEVDPDTGCFNWIQSLCHGYPQAHIMINGVRKRCGGHRLAWERVNGPIPEGDHIRHDCDNRKCVNPDHLRTGNHQDNVDDMDKRKRANRGYTSKPRIKAKQVREIRFRLEVLEDTLVSVARDFEMSRMQIRRIRDRQAWARID